MFPSRMTHGILCCRHGIAALAGEASFVLVQRKEPMTNNVESGMVPLNLNGPMSSEEHHKFIDWLIRRDVIARSALSVLKWHLEGNAQAS